MQAKGPTTLHFREHCATHIHTQEALIIPPPSLAGGRYKNTNSVVIPFIKLLKNYQYTKPYVKAKKDILIFALYEYQNILNKLVGILFKL